VRIPQAQLTAPSTSITIYEPSPPIIIHRLSSTEIPGAVNQNGQLEFEEFLEAFDTMGSMSASEFVVQQRGKEGEEEVETAGAKNQNLEAHKKISDADNETPEADKKTSVDGTETRGTDNETPGT
jgi:hypothetical protein